MAFPRYSRQFETLVGGDWERSWSPVSGQFSVQTDGYGEGMFWWHRINSSGWPYTVGYVFDHWEYSGIIPQMLGSVSSSYRRSSPKGTEEQDGEFLVCAVYRSSSLPPPTPTTPKQVKTAASPTEGGSTTGDGTYEPGSQVTITASENTGYTFVGWVLSNGVTSSNKSFQFTMATIDITAVAYFRKRTNLILRMS